MKSDTEIVFEDAEGNEHKLPTKFEVCPHCEGRGSSSEYLGSWSAEEWSREDDEFKEDYLEGRYDRSCETCNGLRVIPVVNEEQCDPILYKEYLEYQQELRDSAEIQRQERLMEGGWRELDWFGRD